MTAKQTKEWQDEELRTPVDEGLEETKRKIRKLPDLQLVITCLPLETIVLVLYMTSRASLDLATFRGQR